MEEATVILPPGGNGNTVNMRNGASKDHGLVAKVPVGSKVQIVEDDGTWCEIVWDDKRGWMMRKYLERNGGGTQGIEEKLNAIVNAVDAIRAMLGKG